MKTRTEGAFIFADLVGYTAFTEERGDDAAADMARAFCERVCELNRGHGAEDVKMIGDASLIYTSDPAAAVDLALHIIDRIGPVHGFPRVRVGVDWGPAVERAGDWFGTTVNVAARLVALAEEGTVLVTDRVREAAEELPGVAFLDQGAKQLRGLRQPVRLHTATRTVEAAVAHPALADGER